MKFPSVKVFFTMQFRETLYAKEAFCKIQSTPAGGLSGSTNFAASLFFAMSEILKKCIQGSLWAEKK